MKFSVLIPAYNCEVTIPRTVESVRRSGLPAYEIIIVNDGSTDGTAAVLEELCQRFPEITVLNQPNRGVSAARNRALSHAVGDYLLFVDADDTPAENAYRYAAELIERERPDMLLFGMRFEHVHKDVCYQTETLVCPSEGLLAREAWTSQLESLFRCNYLSPVWNKIIRREIVSQNGVRFQEAMFLMEDCRFSIDCLRFCDTIYLLPEALYVYRITDGGKKADARLWRLPSLSSYMEHFSGLPPVFSGIVRGIYEMLLSQRVNSASSLSQLQQEAQEDRLSPFFDEAPTEYRAILALRAGQYRQILRRNRKGRLRRPAVIFCKYAKSRLRGSGGSTDNNKRRCE